MTSYPLHPPLNCNAPIKDLERLWLECACAYEVFDSPLMEDTLWDLLGVELWKRRGELSPYFTEAVGLPWGNLEAYGEEGENPLKTASGINWEEGLPKIVVDGQKDQRELQQRVAQHQARIRRIESGKATDYT